MVSSILVSGADRKAYLIIDGVMTSKHPSTFTTRQNRSALNCLAYRSLGRWQFSAMDGVWSRERHFAERLRRKLGATTGEYRGAIRKRAWRGVMPVQRLNAWVKALASR